MLSFFAPSITKKLKIQATAGLIILETYKIFPYFEDVSARAQILKNIDKLLLNLSDNEIAQVIKYLFKNYLIYKKTSYDYRVVDYLIALGDVKILRVLKKLNFDFNEPNLLDETIIEMLMMNDSLICNTEDAIEYVKNNCNQNSFIVELK